MVSDLEGVDDGAKAVLVGLDAVQRHEAKQLERPRSLPGLAARRKRRAERHHVGLQPPHL